MFSIDYQLRYFLRRSWFYSLKLFRFSLNVDVFSEFSRLPVVSGVNRCKTPFVQEYRTDYVLPFVVILIVGGADFFWEIFRFFRPKKWSFSLHGHPVLEMITSSFFIVLQYKPFKNGHRTIGIDAIFSVNNQPARYAFERKPYERGKS